MFIAGLLLVTALIPYVRAQTSLVGAALDGTISDSTGARMPQVIVTVRNIGTRQARQVSTNSEGAYHVAELAPGTYEVSASQPSFAGYRHTGLVLTLGPTTHLDRVLQPAGVTTQVTVSAQPLPIDPAQTAVSSSFDTERI